MTTRSFTKDPRPWHCGKAFKKHCKRTNRFLRQQEIRHAHELVKTINAKLYRP